MFCFQQHAEIERIGFCKHTKKMMIIISTANYVVITYICLLLDNITLEQLVSKWQKTARPC